MSRSCHFSLRPDLVVGRAARHTRQHMGQGRRAFSVTCARCSRFTAEEAALRLMESSSGSKVLRRQLIDANQVQKLALTLGRRALGSVDILDRPPPIGTPVPRGYHLVYFTPASLESALGDDGSDKTFNAPEPFTRRMWAGGKMEWPTASAVDSLLRVGDEAEEHTRLLSATPKKSRNGSEMVLVEVEKEIWSPRGLAIVDQRSWIFRPELEGAVPVPPRLDNVGSQERTTVEDVKGQTNGFPARRLQWSPVGLFRFSALTFNAHQIHYNEDWARLVEGHPSIVVHGPLNLINILDYWSDIHGGQNVSEIQYRAMAPIYAGERYQIRTGTVEDSETDRRYEVLIEKNGAVCMKAMMSEAKS